MGGRYLALTLNRDPNSLVVPGRLHINNLVVTEGRGHVHGGALTLMDLADPESCHRAHLNGGTTTSPSPWA